MSSTLTFPAGKAAAAEGPCAGVLLLRRETEMELQASGKGLDLLASAAIYRVNEQMEELS